MKITTKTTTTTFFSMLTIVVATGLIMTISPTTSVPTVFAETTVSMPAGSSAPGCEETDACYIPSMVNVDVGETVTWSNDDTAAHTVTSGSAAGGADGVFDSGLFTAGTTFSHTFEEEGTFDYFCMVHPWMVGSVTIGTAMAATNSDVESESESTEMEDIEKTTETEMDTTPTESVEFNVDYDITGGSGNVVNVTPDSDASSVIIELATTEEGLLTITLPRDVMDAKINDEEDDDFFVLVDGEEVVFEETKTDTDRTLAIEFPAGAQEVEIIGTFVIPEFGTIAMMILVVAILSIVVVSAKSRLSIMPRL